MTREQDHTILFVSEVHEAGDGGGPVRSLPFVDDVTWVARGRLVAEVRTGLEGGSQTPYGGNKCEKRIQITQKHILTSTKYVNILPFWSM